MPLAEFSMGAIKRQGQEKLLPRFDDLIQDERGENVGRQHGTEKTLPTPIATHLAGRTGPRRGYFHQIHRTDLDEGWHQFTEQVETMTG